ncbi:hypothetical protein BD289DRAFT_480503 [Coniella lustricola]|uniref:Uncharacterized protein n=1 Tax=Coniella lustricola TaxID=2025994 RepID=A0A2T3AFD9_9PEZI|nr:hypothetical protein BD289DRAFT_480503 [Coniella lustricola]
MRLSALRFALMSFDLTALAAPVDINGALKRDGTTEFDTDLCFIMREEAKRGIIGEGITNCDI